MVLTKAIYREEAYICWLNKSLDLINIHRDSSNYTSKRGVLKLNYTYHQN
nr:hypothetical protein [Paenibacillus larvae]